MHQLFENLSVSVYSKTCVKWPLSKRPKIVFKTNCLLMKVKSIAEMLPLLLNAGQNTFDLH